MSAEPTFGTRVGARRRDTVVIAFFLLLLFVPLAAYAFGVRPSNEENRPLAMMPPLDLVAAGEPAYFAAIDRHLADNFPIKNQLVWANAALRYTLLRTSPSPDVIVGAGDWLFSRESLEPTCTHGATDVLEQFDRINAALADVGVDFQAVIVPDKQAIYPDRLPGGHTPCTDHERPLMMAGMRARGGFATELWSGIEAARALDSEALLYWPRDTHWSPSGAGIGFREVVNSASPTAWSDDVLGLAGEMERVGDLSRLMGLPTVERLPKVVLDPPRTVKWRLLPTTVATTPSRELKNVIITGTPGTIDGRTLIIHDSAFGIYADLLAAWFADSTWLHVNELADHPEIVEGLPRFDRVILERVERFAYRHDYAQMLAPVITLAEATAP